MTTFVALGDSITAGLGDGVSMGRQRVDLAGRGWAAALAGCLDPPGGVRFVNLAATGATVGDVHRSQLPAALAARPDIASVVAGMNDVLRSGFDPDRLVGELTETVVALRRRGALVLMARLHEPHRVFRVPGPMRAALARRVAAVNTAVDLAAGAAGSGVLVLDVGARPETYLRSSWDVDRLHLNARGHRLLARAFAELLAAAGGPVARLPDAGPDLAAPGRAAHLWWLASRGVPWLVLRGGSVAPTLLALARGDQGSPCGDPAG